MSATIAKEEFQKSLARLEGLSKAQLFHTPSDSAPGTWAGSAYEEQDSNADGIDENGTDYTGVKKALAAKFGVHGKISKAELAIVKGENPYPFIKAKLAKGKGLTKAERWAMKGGTKCEPFAKFAKSSEASGTEGGAWQGGKSPEKPGEQHGAGNAPPTNAGSNAEDGEIEHEHDAKKGGYPMAKNGDGDKHPDGCECPMHKAQKSLAHAAATQQNLQKGIEMSPILFEFTRAMDLALAGAEERVKNAVNKALSPVLDRVNTLEKSLNAFAQHSGEFQKGLAEAVVGIGQQVAGGAEQAAQAATQPVGAPKSQLRSIPGGGAPQGVTPIQKSFGPGGLDIGEGAIAKAQIVDAMAEMVKARKLNPLEVVKFESTGELSPGVQQQVMSFVQGGGR